MNGKEIIELFKSGVEEGRTSGQGNLKIKGTLLVHYNTSIAERNQNHLILNMTRYSIITCRIQNDIRNAFKDTQITIITGVIQGYDGLLSEYSGVINGKV